MVHPLPDPQSQAQIALPATDPRSFQFDLPSANWPAANLPTTDQPSATTLREVIQPSATTLREVIHPRAWAHAKPASTPRGPQDQVRVIVIHATAGASTDGAISVIEARRASFHWLVPDENEAAHGRHVWATCPERRAAWHVRGGCAHPNVCNGAYRLNQISLGIELVNTQMNGTQMNGTQMNGTQMNGTQINGRDAFSAWQIEMTAKIVRYAWAKYPNLAHVVSHARLDPGRRTDPGAHFPWTHFQQLVLGR